ncbi:MAG: hypothetical protein AAGC80_27105 [Rhodococcus sp. (in: high G+C Gram-positive bacteria)]
MTASTRTQDAFPTAWVEHWLDAVNTNPEVQVIGRWTRLHLVLECGFHDVTLEFDQGSLRRVPAGLTTTRDRVVFTGSDRAWNSMLVPHPAPRCNDVLALDRHDPDFDVTEGREVLIKHLRVLLAIFRIAAQTEGRR